MNLSYTIRLNSKLLHIVQAKLTTKSKVKQINKNNKPFLKI